MERDVSLKDLNAPAGPAPASGPGPRAGTQAESDTLRDHRPGGLGVGVHTGVFKRVPRLKTGPRANTKAKWALTGSRGEGTGWEMVDEVVRSPTASA